ncbi:MAG TPA: hypothetical protein VK978_00165 [Candidatus Saccharimonadales bacterium]|nr:hypothetical protein [Candidatus Saccharimonadales bacterium]
MITRKSLAVVGALLGMTLLSSCSQAAQPGQVGVVVDDYFVIPADPVILDCIQPETEQFHVVNNVYRYPARQISWAANNEPGAERVPYTVVSSREAPAELFVPVTITMDLNLDCQTLSDFHRKFGTKGGGAWLDENGNVTDGWIALLAFVVGEPTDVTLDRLALQYPWQQIWNDDTIRVEFENALEKELPQRVMERSAGNEFFTNIQVSVGKPEPVDPNLKTAIAQEQSAIAEANAARLAAEAQEQTAKAETRVAVERALQKQAEIAGYPTVDDYLREQMIQKGLNPYQPTWLAPGMTQN